MPIAGRPAEHLPLVRTPTILCAPHSPRSLEARFWTRAALTVRWAAMQGALRSPNGSGNSTGERITNTFANIHVNADGSFAGPVKLSLNNVPTGLTATLVPSVVDLSASTLQVVQLQFQTATSPVPFGPTAIQVIATSGSLTAATTVFIAT